VAIPVWQADPAPGTTSPAIPGTPAQTPAEASQDEPAAEPAEPGYFMAMMSGTCFGNMLESKGVRVSGWAQMSYTHSSNNVTNLPGVTFNDRANSFLFQQFWVNIEKAIDTESNEVHGGFKVAFLAGSDYRFTLMRGIFNNQLKNTRSDFEEPNGFRQNLYGVDLPQFYASLWLPGVMGEGTEVRVGRMFEPNGFESVEGPTAPLLSRDYDFTWAPPFFHVGIALLPKFNKNLSAFLMLANGNDVFFDGSDELRFVGNLIWQSDDGSDRFTIGTSLGRGKFNAGRPNGPAEGITTIGLAYEPFGRNNFNDFDMVYVRKWDDFFTTATEFTYGYQQGVPAGATGSTSNFNGGSGTADWWSITQYFIYNFTEQVGSIARLEVFEDVQGSRTGFEGVYYAGTLGLQFRPTNSVMFRPEIRYDYNEESRPFEGKHGLFTAAADLIFKF